MSKQEDLAIREQLRLAFAAFFMGCEIAGVRGVIDDNSELAARGLRRADSLFQQHDGSKGAPRV